MTNWLKNNFLKIKESLFKTRNNSIEEITKSDYIEITEDFFDDLFDKFIKADIGFEFSEKIISSLKNVYKSTGQQLCKKDFQDKLKEIIKQELNTSPVLIPHLPVSSIQLFLIVGVNGSGKTTSIGKLAKKFKDEGKKVLIVAADTFRAAAGEQLDIWAKRAGVEIYAPVEIKKPDAVVFSAIEKAKKENYNLLLIDTAGRLHSQTNLMEELKKINSVIEKQVGALHAAPLQYKKLIVLDATIGQNAINQAETFSKTTKLDGIILSKLDSSSKGGVVLNIINKLKLSVVYIGSGEQIDDLAEFNLDEYLEGLLR